jgi:sterol desaturase/sphingolipid hydroxylase (fatty acid hydroxylase superfamily)
MQPPVQTLLLWKSLAVGLWLAAFFLAERLAPAAVAPADVAPWRRLGRNAGLYLVNIGLSPLLVLPLAAWAASHALPWRPSWWSGWPALLVDLAVLDFLIYWWHRANHVVPFLWRFHEVHHLDRFLDTTSAVRFHFGEVVLSALARAAAILVLDIPFASVVAFETAVLGAAIFHHSNLALPPRFERALARLVVTPSIHWVHHHRVRRDTDSNYGTLLSAWDALFRSRSATARAPDMPIGVKHREEQTLLRLIARPFARLAEVPLPGGESQTTLSRRFDPSSAP